MAEVKHSDVRHALKALVKVITAHAVVQDIVEIYFGQVTLVLLEVLQGFRQELKAALVERMVLVVLEELNGSGSREFGKDSHEPVVVGLKRSFIDDSQFDALKLLAEDLDEFVDGSEVLVVLQISDHLFKYYLQIELFEGEFGVIVALDVHIAQVPNSCHASKLGHLVLKLVFPLLHLTGIHLESVYFLVVVSSSK